MSNQCLIHVTTKDNRTLPVTDWIRELVKEEVKLQMEDYRKDIFVGGSKNE